MKEHHWSFIHILQQWTNYFQGTNVSTHSHSQLQPESQPEIHTHTYRDDSIRAIKCLNWLLAKLLLTWLIFHFTELSIQIKNNIFEETPPPRILTTIPYIQSPSFGSKYNHYICPQYSEPSKRIKEKAIHTLKYIQRK